MDDDVALGLLREYRSTGSRAIRNQVVEAHVGLAIHVARKFSPNRSDDDLRQVALLGLVRAVDRFDPERGVPFGAFAVTSLEGELKRHFRDQTWAAKVPRSAKELHLAVRRGVDELGQMLGRSPSVEELARHLDLDRDDVIAGLEAGAARSSSSLDGGSGAGDDDSPSLVDVLPASDDGFDHAERRAEVEWLLARLPDREREIVVLRFFDELSQSEIAERVGVSQMHVSRLLRRAFETMRVLVEGATVTE